MKRLSDNAIEIVNELHTERLDYEREYVPIIDALNRLAEYEDIGLEPEKIVFLKNVVDDAFSDKPEFTEHIRELLRAEKDGRLVILPCKVGDRVYQVIPDYTAPDNSLFIEEDVFHLGLLTDSGELPANCYFTLKAAEKALEAANESLI